MTNLPEPEVHRPVSTARITLVPTGFVVTATAEECRNVAARLGIVALPALSCTFDLRRGDDTARGQISATAVLAARVVQDCVVTLEPFEAEIGEAFRVHFVHAGTEVDDLDPETDDEIPYTGETIDLGEAAVEQLALSLDPYPRKPGAELPDDVAGDVASPFAMLARRPRRED